MAEIANADKSSGHTVRVRLGDRGDVVYEGTHRLDRRDGTVAPSVVLDDELPDDPGRYVATAWLDGSDDPSRLAVADHAGADCVVLLVMVFESGLGITTMDRCGG